MNPLSVQQVRAATKVSSVQEEHNDFISSYLSWSLNADPVKSGLNTHICVCGGHLCCAQPISHSAREAAVEERPIISPRFPPIHSTMPDTILNLQSLQELCVLGEIFMDTIN